METWHWILLAGLSVLSLVLRFIRRKMKLRRLEEDEAKEQVRENERITHDFLNDAERYFTLNTNDWVSPSLKKKYEKALDKNFLLKVHQQYIKEHPKRRHDSHLYWQELHRYLFMAGIFKQMEMFSEEVDHIWHIMLEYPTEYELFCHKFVGRVIEHKPHGEKQHKPKERALQDILYIMLFPLDSNSVRILGTFLEKERNAFVLEWCREFQSSTTVEMEKKLMLPGTSPMAQNLLHDLVEEVKDSLVFNEKEAKKAQTRRRFVEEPDYHRHGADYSGTLLTQVQVNLFADEWAVVEKEVAERNREIAEKEAALYAERAEERRLEAQKNNYDSGSYGSWGSSSKQSSSSDDDHSGSSSSCSSGGGSSSSCSSCSSCSS